MVLDGIATRPELQREPGACSTFLNAEVSKAERFANFAVTDEAGRVTCASASLLLGRDVSGMPWFQEVKGRGGAVLSEVVPEQQPGEGRRVVLAMPLLRDGQFIGTLSGGLAVPRFAVLPSGLELPDGAVAYLVDRTGRLVSDADPSSLTLPGWSDIVSLIAEAESIVVADGPSGRMQFVAVPVQRERVYALVGLPAPLWSWLERDLVLGLIVPVLMLALAVIGIWIATDYLVNRHIHTLARAARDYATGRHAAWPGLRGAPTELRQLTQVLAQTTEELSARESELKASLAQKEVLLREIHHRVKNNLQVVTSLLNLRAQAATSPAARLAMIEAQSRIKAMALVHRDLYEGEEVGAVELQTLLGELCHLLEDTVPGRVGEVELKLALEPTRLSIDRAVPVALFVTEAVSNAFKHAFPEGRRGTVTVRLGRTPTSARLEISDDGVGIENGQGAPGLGLTLMRMLAGQTGGRLAIDNSQGTAVRLEFPLQSRKAPATAPHPRPPAPDPAEPVRSRRDGASTALWPIRPSGVLSAGLGSFPAMEALRYACGLALLALVGCGGSRDEEPPLAVAATAGQPSKEAAKLIARSIWAVVPETPARKRDLLSEMIRGSAVAVSADTLLVSCRVVDGLGRVGIARHNKYRFARVVAADQGRSVCLLQASDTPLNVVRGFRWCGDLVPGEPIYAAASRTSTEVTVTEGHVTARHGTSDACALGDRSRFADDRECDPVRRRRPGGGARDRWRRGGTPTAVSVPVARDAGSDQLRLVLSPTELSTVTSEGVGESTLSRGLSPDAGASSAAGSGGEVTGGS